MMSKESRSLADEIEELKTRKSELELQAPILASEIRAQKAELDDKKAQHAKFKEYLKKTHIQTENGDGRVSTPPR